MDDHLAALALVSWFLMMPPDSAKIPHDVEAEAPLSRWVYVATYDTEDHCEKALTNIQNSEQDPSTLDRTGRLAKLQRPPDAALGKARALNAACVAADDIRLKSSNKK